MFTNASSKDLGIMMLVSMSESMCFSAYFINYLPPLSILVLYSYWWVISLAAIQSFCC